MIHITLRRWPYISWHRESVSVQSIGWIALFVCIVSASTYNAFAKILTGALSPLSLLFLSEFLTAFFAVMSYGLMPLIRSTMKLPKSTFLPLLCVGLMSGTIAPLLLFPGLQMSSAVNASLFGNMEMVFMIFLAVLVLHEQFRREHALSVCTMLAGMLIIALRGFTEGLHLYPGDALLVLAGFSFATGSIIYRKYLHHVQPQVILFVRASVAVILFFILSAVLQEPILHEILSFPVALLPVLIGFGFISRFLNIFSFYEALERLPVTVVSLFNNLTVITSIIFANWILHEDIKAYHVIGGLLLILGTVLLEIVGTHRTEIQLENHLRQRPAHR